jgi:hypothetical protein
MMFVGALKEMEKLLCDLKKKIHPSYSRVYSSTLPLLGDAVCLANDELLRAKLFF